MESLGPIVLVAVMGVALVLAAIAVGVVFLRSSARDEPSTGEVEDQGGLPPGSRPLDDDVEFTVYRPGRAAAGAVNQLLFFAHLGEPRPDDPPGTPHPRTLVETQAAAVLGEGHAHQATSGVPAARPVPRDELLTVTPLVEGCAFEPATAALRWQGPVHRLDFRFTVPEGAEGTDLRGSVLVQFMGTLVLAEIPLVIRVGGEDVHALVPTPPVRPYRRIFPSYSRTDSAVIEVFQRYAMAFGDEYLRDILVLRSGDDWKRALRELIERADVFQLFWSHAAARSDEVRSEWTHALSLDRPGFVRPLMWEQPRPPIPEALSGLHFTHIDVPGVDVPSTEDDGTGLVAPPRPMAAPPRSSPAARLDEDLLEAPKRSGGALGLVAASFVLITAITAIVIGVFWAW